MAFKTFQSLKKNRQQATQKLQEQIEGETKGFRDPIDETYWSLTRDKSGTGQAVIRFLPAPPNEDLSYVKIYDYWFKGPGGYYVELSPTTIDKPCPVFEYNNKLWNSVVDDDAPERAQARKQKRGLSYHANIYVVKDPGNPDNEGKVFRFKFPKTIFKMIEDSIKPEFEGDDPVDVFDLWEGKSLKLRIRNENGFAKYDKSDWGDKSQLFEDEDKMEEVWKQCYSLAELISEERIKSYSQLKQRLYDVLKLTSTGEKEQTPTDIEVDNYTGNFKIDDSDSKEESTDIDDLLKSDSDFLKSDGKSDANKSFKDGEETSDKEDDFDMEFFKKLADK